MGDALNRQEEQSDRSGQHHLQEVLMIATLWRLQACLLQWLRTHGIVKDTSAYAQFCTFFAQHRTFFVRKLHFFSP